MSVALSYVLTEHRRRVLVTARTVVLLTVTLTLAFFLAAFWPAKEFAETAAFARARFDVSVNGPLRRGDVERIVREVPGDAACIAVYSGNLTSVEARGRELEGTPAVLYPAGRGGDVRLTYFSPGLLVSGGMDAVGSAGVDAITASRLHIGVGDVLTYRQRVDANGAHDLRGSARVSAIFAPTAAASGVVLPLTPGLARALAGREHIVGSDLFIKTGGASARDVAGRLAALDGAENWNVAVVADQLARAHRDVEGMASRSIRAAMVLGPLLVYAAYVLRDQSSRVERRKKDVAIMVSLGEPIRRISAVFVAEQLALAAATTVLGMWLAQVVLSRYLYLYVPGSSRLLVGALAVGINAMVAVAVAVHLRYRVARMPIPSVLATE